MRRNYYLVFYVLSLLIPFREAIAQTYTIGADNGTNGAMQYPSPFFDYYKTQRAQYLYRASEITAMGMTAGYITEVSWNVVNVPPSVDVSYGYTVKLLSTAVTSLGLTTWESGGTLVWGPVDYTPVVGINTFVLDVPFFWDGVSNLIVEICNGPAAGEYTKNAKVTWTGPLAFNGSHTRTNDLELNPCEYTGIEYWEDSPGGPDYRPQAIFTRVDGVNCAGTPDAGSASSTASSVCVGEVFTVSIDPIIAVGITYQWQKSTDGAVWTNIAGAVTASYNITQTLQTLYRCNVTCTASGFSDVSSPVNVMQNDPADCYCIPVYTTGTIEGDYISNVTLETINNSTAAAPAPFYTYYSGITTDLNPGSAYTISISVGTYLTNNGVAAWIDYNADGDFLDAGEKLGEVTAIAAYGTGNINFTVPADAVIGTTRLRTRDIWNQVGMQPCLEYGYGETEDYNVNIAPGNPPVASFDFTGDPEVSFTDLSTNSPTSWSWDFGDGGSSTIQHPDHTYALNGTYEVCLTATNDVGSDEFCDNVLIDSYLAPSAAFVFSGDPDVSFTDISSNLPTSWSWNFGDGGTSILQHPDHTYAENGTYNVCLTATNAAGSDMECHNVIIDSYLAPAAEFIFSGDPDVSFTDISTNLPTSWFWDFGDGFTSTEQNPEHVFTENGTYYVCLTATNDVGSDVSCQYVLIDSYEFAPEASFTYYSDPSVFFIDFSTEEPNEWYWDFGDGFTSTDQNPTHVYAANGTYIVCLTATNDVGSNTSCQTIVIDGYPSPNALFTYVNDPIVNFTDLTDNDPVSWFWDFDDGTYSLDQNPVHAFALNDVYTVCLTVVGAGGTDMYCDNIEIESAQLAPVADFYYTLGAGNTVEFTDLSGNDPTNWTWDFGDGSISMLPNPSHTYANKGNYEVCLTASNDVGNDFTCKTVELSDAIQEQVTEIKNIYPNPASEMISIEINESVANYTIELMNVLGQPIDINNSMMHIDGNRVDLQIKDLPAGNYFIMLSGDKVYIGSFIKE